MYIHTNLYVFTLIFSAKSITIPNHDNIQEWGLVLYSELCSPKPIEYPEYSIQLHNQLDDHPISHRSKFILQEYTYDIYHSLINIFEINGKNVFDVTTSRSQIIITSVLVSFQFLATLVWVCAAIPDAKTYFPTRDMVSRNTCEYK